MSPEDNKGSTDRDRVVAHMQAFGLDEEMVTGWLASESAHLGGRVPNEVIEQIGFEDMQPAVDAYLNGDLASEFDSTLKDSAESGGQILPFRKPE